MTSLHFPQRSYIITDHLLLLTSMMSLCLVRPFLFIKSSLFCLILVTHSKDFLHVLIHHIGDADSRDDFEKVGGDTTIQALYAINGNDVFELAHHGQLGFTLSDG